MKIFKPLINLNSYDTFIKERLQKGTPSAYRFGKRYGIVIQDNENVKLYIGLDDIKKYINEA